MYIIYKLELHLTWYFIVLKSCAKFAC